MKTFHLSSVALLIGGIALSGCAPKQAWSPELEEARKVYKAAASDPSVSSLAAAELDQAKKQLQVAEDASDFFKGPEVIAHEATLAELKSKEALQVARALTAKKNIKIAQASSQPSGPRIGAPDSQSPIIAAANPPHAMTKHAGSMQGGSAAATMTETQLIAQQLAALSNQLNQLQNRIASGALQNGAATTQNSESTIQLPAVIQTQSEPTLGAARPAPNSASLELAPELVPEQEPETIMVTGARLNEELRAMNARPTSRGMSLTLGERYFESGSARLWNGRAGRHLDNIAAVLVENPDLLLEIEAHTDNTGTAEHRDNLTSDRAIAIKSALVLRGVNASRINATGFGDSAPLAGNDAPLGRLQNRRVEIIFPNVAK